MKLWLDDVREPLNKSWHWVKTGEEAIELLKQGMVDSISFHSSVEELRLISLFSLIYFGKNEYYI